MPDSALVREIDAAFKRLSQYRDIMGREELIACVVSDNSYVDFGGLLRTTAALGKIGFAKVVAAPSAVRKYRTIAECYEFPWPLEADRSFVSQCLGPQLDRKAADFFPPRKQLADEHTLFIVRSKRASAVPKTGRYMLDHLERWR